MKNIALKYLEKGFSIIPIKKEDKSPFIPSWLEFNDRKPTAEEVSSWWDIYPEANIGIITGRISGISVLDVDWNEKGNTESGLAYHNDLPKTLTARSGSGGLHFYYKYSPKADGIKNLRHRIDIKSSHGYIIAPPSVHASGGKYEWIDRAEMVAFPEDLIIVPEQRRTTIRDVLFGIGEGGRNIAAASLVGICIKNNLTPEDTYAFMTGWNMNCNPSLTESELRTVIQSVYNTAERRTPVIDDEIIHLAEASKLHKQEFDGVFYPLGYKIFDEVLKGGIKVGDLGVITGHSGHGKSLLAQIISRTVLKEKKKVMWFQFELMPDEFWEKFQAMGVTEEDLIYVPKNYQNGSLTWIEKKISEGKKRDINLYFIDLIDFLKPKLEEERKKVSGNLSSYITVICEQLKEICKQQKVAIVLMAHTRKPEQGRVDSEPSAFDVKDSAGIIQHSDWLFTIHRLNKREARATGILNETMGMSQIDSPSQWNDDKEDTMFSKIKMWKNRRTGKRPYLIVEFRDGLLKEVF